MLLATWQVGQLVWAMFWFALLFLTVWVIVWVFADLFRSPDLSGWAKALWTIFILLFPWLGVVVYLVARGEKGSERRFDDAYSDQAVRGYSPWRIS